jgi:hypothetical protein
VWLRRTAVELVSAVGCIIRPGNKKITAAGGDGDSGGDRTRVASRPAAEEVTAIYSRVVSLGIGCGLAIGARDDIPLVNNHTVEVICLRHYLPVDGEENGCALQAERVGGRTRIGELPGQGHGLVVDERQGDRWDLKFHVNRTTIWHSMHHPDWEPPGSSLHYEYNFSIRRFLKGHFDFAIHSERKRGEEFLERFQPRYLELEKGIKERGIAYRPSNSRKSLAWKRYKVDQNMDK